MIKKKIKYFLRKSPECIRHIQYIYNVLLKRDRLMKKVSYGEKNFDKKILVIRPNSEDGVQGLMSLFIQNMRWIEYANRNNYEPYVDFLNYKTQYYDGKTNAWEYYFKQNISYDEIKESKNIIISGSTWRETIDYELFRDRIFKDKQFAQYCNSLIWNNLSLSDEAEEILSKESERLNINKCLGVYIRGTDYVSLKPTGEYVQPDINAVVKKTKEFLEKYEEAAIFLVTEDGRYYNKMKAEFGDKILLASYDKFIENYDGKNYLSKSNVLDVNRKKRGMEYLVKILLLSKCKYLVSSITMGSLAAYSFNGGIYEDSYIFELGYYK